MLTAGTELRIFVVGNLMALAMGGGSAQGLRLQDVGPFPQNQTAGYLAQAPLTPTQRAELQRAIDVHDYSRAEVLMAAEIEKNPKATELYKLIASIFFLDGRYLNAAVALKKAEAIAPLDDKSRFTLVLAYIILNHRDWARPELAKLIESAPRSPLYPYWMGRIDYDAAQFKVAITEFQKTLELDSDFMKAYDNLGLCYEALGQYGESIKTYKKAIELNRQKKVPSPWPPLNLATLLVKLGKLGEARTFIQECLRYDCRFPRAHFQMGLLLEKENKSVEAISELQEAAALDPTFADPHYVLGKIYHRIGKESEAQQALATFQKLKKEGDGIRPH